MRKLSPSVSFLLLLVSGLHADLIHRYSFDGTSQDGMVDSIGDANAVLHSGAQLDAKGALDLDGVNDWAELPGTLFDGLHNVTIEAWVKWDGPATSSWQTLFAVSKDNSSYFSFSPRAGTSPRKSRFAVAQSGPEKKINGQDEFPVGTMAHLVSVLDVTNQQLRLYLDGQLQGTAVCSYSLESLGVQNFWLGRPLYAQFPYFKGRYLEFRVYDDAFSEDQVSRSTKFGPEELPGPAITSFIASKNPVRSGSKVNLNWETSANAKVVINPSDGGELVASGMLEVTSEQTTEFILEATNEDGTRTAKLIVEVDDRPIINSFTANPRVVVPGDPVVLSWDVAYATSVSINQDIPGISGASGSIELRPDTSLTYIITASNDSGSRTARVSVSVPGRLDVVINEVHYDSNPKTEKTEFLELYNNRANELDLSGWHFSDGITYSFPDGTRLPAGAYFVLAEDATAFESQYGQKPDGIYTGSLSNNGERLVLRDAAGGRMDEVFYNVGFPWPTTPSGEGPSMQLLNPQIDNDLGGSWRPATPTPGARNSIYSEAPPPRVRQVRHNPEQPATGQLVTIKAKVTSVEEITEVSIDYQVVAPGDYITIDDSRYATSWSALPMQDDGLLGDVDAGDSTYTIVLPATVSAHRHLVRYRITAKDAKGATVTTPMADDSQPNFAFFCYDGVPSWQGSARPGHTSVVTYSKELLESLPVYHLITTRKAHVDSQYIPNSGSGKYGGSE
ncbi:MAG: lamin tail domain-containing protein, partial [Opitutales bacterium]|nr:lamin tail domain-containing protein [Opitutales bacterium]